METADRKNTYPFLAGGGEMGKLVRNHDWSATTLGTPDQWPQSLRTTLSIILNSRFPMFLFWGPEHICFYNDAYRPSLGDEGKPPGALGQPGAQVWPDIWTVIKPLLDQVMSGGEATYDEDRLLPILRNGKMEDVYWTASYSPVVDEQGVINGVFTACFESTTKVANTTELQRTNQQLDGLLQQLNAGVSQLEASEARFRLLVDQAPVAIAVFRGPDHIIEMANEAYQRLVGRPAEKLLGKPMFDAMPEIKGQGYEERLENVLTTGNPFYTNELSATLMRNGQLETLYFNFVYQPLRDQDGTISGVAVVANEITEQVQARKTIEQNEAELNFAINATELGVWDLNPLTNSLKGNARLKSWFGLPSDKELDLSLALESIVDQDRERVAETIEQALRYESGGRYDTEYTIVHPLTRQRRLVRAKGKTQFGPDQVALRLNGTLQDITEAKQAEEALLESEARFRSVFEEATVAACLFVGREFRIELVNEMMLGFWGKDRSVIGKPLAEAVPELKGQPFLSILDEVFTSGQAYSSKDARAELEVDGVLGTYYFDFTYKPLFNTAGEVYAIMDMAIDVTEQVVSHQKIEEAESSLRGAIELAELGTWKMDVATGQMTYSERLKGWLGVTDAVMGREASPRVHPKDRERVSQAMVRALETGGNGRYDETYTITHALTGQERIIRASGQTLFDAEGNALLLAGTAQDVTLQQEMQLALEQQVQQRTQELQAANYELTRSNENLQQFAYIASHDLQEPLRKIQSFGDLLRNQYGVKLGDGVDYLRRMQEAAGRMSILIRDLLTYSRISTQQDTSSAVSLTDVVRIVLSDVELLIEETGATILLDPLPVVQGDAVQLGQLFQNLLSNALKFRQAGQVPVIRVTSSWLAAERLPADIVNSRASLAYHRIDVIDNGIGFEEKYKSRIFQVFQRLHGKDQYAGTGIGLAICEKVAANHGGGITTTSQPGEGATFSVYLPV